MKKNTQEFTKNTKRSVMHLQKIKLLFIVLILTSITSVAQKQMEDLDRGVLAIRKSRFSVLISWRILGTEFENASYNIYQGSTKLNTTPITGASNFIHDTTVNGTYSVSAIINSIEQQLSTPVDVWNDRYKKIPLTAPNGGTTPDNVDYTYEANDASVGDLDGDGEYEIVLKWYPSNAKDNSHNGYTGNTILQGLKMDGTILWTIDLGKNIRSGSHYTQFMVYDLDGDGKAEIACKTADGTKDALGNILGDPNADYRNTSGRVLSGPEYFSIFSGETGAFLIKDEPYDPPRGNVSSWGDDYGNRVDRFLACIAYLDGVRPSLVFARGYYTRTVLAAYDYRNGALTKRWVFDSDIKGSQYEEQGNHSITVGDVDQDGKDEIVYGSLTIDDDGEPYSSTGYAHGDSSHLGDFNPITPGLEYFVCHEASGNNAKTALGNFGALKTDINPKVDFRGNSLGEIFWQVNQAAGTKADIGRCLIADIDPNHLGAELWAADGSGIHDINGTVISTSYPTTAGNGASYNMLAWYDGDLLRELVDRTVITKWNAATESTSRVLTAYNYDNLSLSSNNSSKSTPCLIADILGDWREEIIWRSSDNTYLAIISSPDVTTERIFTLMHDPLYRTSIAWQNVAYNQPAHTGFYLGVGMETPPTPDIYLTNNTLSTNNTAFKKASNIKVYPNPTTGLINLSGINNGTIQVYNILGELVLEKNASNSTTLNLKNKPSGIYIIKATHKTGIETFKIKLN